MDGLSALESGELAPVATPTVPVLQPVALAARWALEEKLRPGSKDGPRAAALVPVVEAWARRHGLAGHVEAGALARALRLAGFTFRQRIGLLLHPEDASRLWTATRAAWAPAHPPGDPRAQPKVRRKHPTKRRKLRPPPAMPLFHEELARQSSQCTPLVDSVGRVWPRASLAVLALGGNKKAIDNARRKLGTVYAQQGRGGPELHTAMREGTAWRGVFWRHLQPWEVQHVPATARAGDTVLGLGWYLGGCPTCKACSAPTWAGTVSVRQPGTG
jgi:hypothetical protein